MERVVSDSSILIHLSFTNRLDLLKECYSHLVIPQAVLKEVVEQGNSRPGAIEVKKAINEGWIEVLEIKNIALSHSLKQNLHSGEAESIVLAIEHPGPLLLIDETEARRTARLYNLKMTGTVGILIKAKSQDKVLSLRDELDKLKSSGFWLSDDVMMYTEKQFVQQVSNYLFNVNEQR